jgi:outer membrane protein OmpA-like peptidoglycan-associated protein
VRCTLVIAVLVGCGAAPDGAAPTMPVAADRDRDRDADGDAIPDDDDRCVCATEDRDGWEDDDGCPDDDDDDDRILDVCDHCPRGAEVYNGFWDEDGCPDRSEMCGSMLETSTIAIRESIYFAARATEAGSESLPLLEALATTLLGNPSVTRVRVTGRVDRREARRVGLALARAEWVRTWLVAHGVPAERLVAEAADPALPDPHADDAARQRRVDLAVIEIDGEPIAAGSERPAQPPPETPSCEPPWPALCPEGPPAPPPVPCHEESASCGPAPRAGCGSRPWIYTAIEWSVRSSAALVRRSCSRSAPRAALPT